MVVAISGSPMKKFPWLKKSGKLEITKQEKVYKSNYLGNVQISLVKGEGCLKKPLECIWNHYMKQNQQSSEMVITVTTTGLLARTAEQGTITYKAHRISYFQAPSDYARVFAWVYRHESRTMKYESRCHAILLPDQSRALDLNLDLREKLSFAFKEFVKAKQRRGRLPNIGNNAVPGNPKRRQLLNPGLKYKPPAEDEKYHHSRLSSIQEQTESIEEVDEDDGSSFAFSEFDEDEEFASESSHSRDLSRESSCTIVEVEEVSNDTHLLPSYEETLLSKPL